MKKRRRKRNLGDIVKKAAKTLAVYGSIGVAFYGLYLSNNPYKELPLPQEHTVDATGTVLHVDAKDLNSMDSKLGYRKEYRIWVKGNDGNIYYMSFHDTDWNNYLYEREGLNELKPGDEVHFSGKIESYRLPRQNPISKRSFPDKIGKNVEKYYPVYYADVGKY